MSRVALAVLAMLATGCILQANAESEEIGFINAAWRFRNADGSPASCPAEAVAEVTAQPVEGGEPIIQIYPCDAESGSLGYPLGEYDVTIAITNVAGGTQLATSLVQRVDIVLTDATVAEEFIADGGRVMLQWMLVDAATAEALDCTAAGSSEVSISIAGEVLTQFPCTDGGGISSPVVAGTYEVSIAAVNLAGDQVGAPQLQTIEVGEVGEVGQFNDYQDLGVIVLPID